MVDAVIEAKSLGKYYRIYRGGIEKWMDLLLPGNHGINFWALRKLSFQVSAGTGWLKRKWEIHSLQFNRGRFPSQHRHTASERTDFYDCGERWIELPVDRS